MSKKITFSIYTEYGVYPCGTLEYSDKTFYFSYGKTWRESSWGFPLSPAFPLDTKFFTTDTLPKPFKDATADAFGQKAMNRGAAFAGEFLNGIPVRLNEFDYFANTHPVSRQGAFVFPDDTSKMYQIERFEKKVNKTSLQNCIFSIDREQCDPTELLKHLKYIHSSGGMRPKYSFLDNDELWLAKTNSREDIFPNGVLWEAVNLHMASLCGIVVPQFYYEKDWLCVKRFDRENGIPVPYISANTMLNSQENQRVSYADIAQWCNKEESQELFRRCCFNVAVSNCDEHLKNHGFLRRNNRWNLSPVFDIMSIPTTESAQEHSLIIGNNSYFGTLENIVADAQQFGFFQSEATIIAKEIFSLVESSWIGIAERLGAEESQIKEMKLAYVHNTFLNKQPFKR